MTASTVRMATLAAQKEGPPKRAFEDWLSAKRDQAVLL